MNVLDLPLHASPDALSDVVRWSSSNGNFPEDVREFASFLNQRRREREARIDRGEECPTCRGHDVERTDVIAPLFTCRRCSTSWFDLNGEVVG